MTTTKDYIRKGYAEVDFDVQDAVLRMRCRRKLTPVLDEYAETGNKPVAYMIDRIVNIVEVAPIQILARFLEVEEVTLDDVKFVDAAYNKYKQSDEYMIPSDLKRIRKRYE